MPRRRVRVAAGLVAFSAAAGAGVVLAGSAQADSASTSAGLGTGGMSASAATPGTGVLNIHTGDTVGFYAVLPAKKDKQDHEKVLSALVTLNASDLPTGAAAVGLSPSSSYRVTFGAAGVYGVRWQVTETLQDKSTSTKGKAAVVTHTVVTQLSAEVLVSQAKDKASSKKPKSAALPAETLPVVAALNAVGIHATPAAPGHGNVIVPEASGPPVTLEVPASQLHEVASAIRLFPGLGIRIVTPAPATSSTPALKAAPAVELQAPVVPSAAVSPSLKSAPTDVAQLPSAAATTPTAAPTTSGPTSPSPVASRPAAGAPTVRRVSVGSYVYLAILGSVILGALFLLWAFSIKPILGR